MKFIPGVRRSGRLTAAAAAMVLYGLSGCSNTPGDLRPLTHGAMAHLELSKDRPAAPDTVFHDAVGGAHTLSEFKGRIVVLNLWANWCAPCKEEIPSLAKLSAAYAGKPVSVVAISLGKDEDEVAGKRFIAANSPLVFYTEPTYALAYALKPPAEGLPATIILDRDGKERARLSGGADWSGADAKAVIEALLAEK